MTPVPEPVCDINAQVAAMLDGGHPKRAVLVVPGNAVPSVDVAFRIERAAGTLLTNDRARADAFVEGHADEGAMAWILGYPQDKTAIMVECGNNAMFLARAVQARDEQGSVVTEAFAAPSGLAMTQEVIGEHVPAGGGLMVLTPVDAIVRRVLLRLLRMEERV